MKNIILKIVVFLFSVAMGYFGTGFFIKNTPPEYVGTVQEVVQKKEIVIQQIEKGVTENIVADGNSSKKEAQSTNEVVAPKQIDVEFTISGKKLQKDAFAFTVTPKNLPEGVKIERYDISLKTDSMVAIQSASSNGMFTGIAYTSKDGTYLLRGMTSDNNFTTFKEITGFVKPVEVKKIEKMTVAELQTLFDNINADKKWMNNHEKIARKPAITVKNEGGDIAIENMTKLYQKIKFENKKVVVVSISYDASNKVNKMVLELK